MTWLSSNLQSLSHTTKTLHDPERVNQCSIFSSSLKRAEFLMRQRAVSLAALHISRKLIARLKSHIISSSSRMQNIASNNQSPAETPGRQTSISTPWREHLCNPLTRNIISRTLTFSFYHASCWTCCSTSLRYLLSYAVHGVKSS